MSDVTVEVVLAGLPVVAIVVLLLLRVRPLRAVLLAIALTLALSPWFPLTVNAISDSIGTLSYSVLSAVFIMLGGIVLSEILAESGAQNRISDWLERAAGSGERSILLLGLGVAPLAESVIGFGVGVITTVPLLLRAGLTPTRAATVSLLGIILAPWGSMGPGLLISTGLSGIGLTELGTWTAVLNLPVQVVMGVGIGLVGLGVTTVRRYAVEIGIVTLVMWGVLVAVNLWIAPALGGITASAAGIAGFICCARLRGTGRVPMGALTRRSFMPYIFLVVLVAAMTGISAVVNLGAAEQILTGPALWIMLIAVIAPWLLRMPRADVIPSVLKGVRLWRPVCVLTLLYIVFGALLSVNGMSGRLAEEASNFGGLLLYLIPPIGALAGYVTNSGSASAALVAVGITEAAHAVGFDSVTGLAVQNVASGAAIMMCPARVAVAAGVANALCGENKREVNTSWAMRVLLIANAVVVITLVSSVGFLER